MHLLYLVMDTNAIEKALATGVVLVITIIVINAITNWLSQRFRARMTGGA
jgi:ABC-type phosphate transport system permease subunit